MRPVPLGNANPVTSRLIGGPCMNVNILALGLGAMAGLFMAVQGAMNAMLTKAIGIFETSLIVNLLG